MKIKYTLYVFFGIKQIQNPPIETGKPEKHNKKNELSMHTGINIPSRIPKTILKIQKKLQKNIRIREQNGKSEI